MSFASNACGVGKNEDPIPDMRGTKGGSRYAVPFSVIPERGQVSKDDSKSSVKERCDVLHEDESRLKKANDTGELVPQS
jgi:hypothetical protein